MSAPATPATENSSWPGVSEMARTTARGASHGALATAVDSMSTTSAPSADSDALSPPVTIWSVLTMVPGLARNPRWRSSAARSRAEASRAISLPEESINSSATTRSPGSNRSPSAPPRPATAIASAGGALPSGALLNRRAASVALARPMPMCSMASVAGPSRPPGRSASSSIRSGTRTRRRGTDDREAGEPDDAEPDAGDAGPPGEVIALLSCDVRALSVTFGASGAVGTGPVSNTYRPRAVRGKTCLYRW